MYGLMAELVCMYVWMFSLDQTSSPQFIPIDIIIIIISIILVVVVVVVAISNLRKSIIYQKPPSSQYIR